MMYRYGLLAVLVSFFSVVSTAMAQPVSVPLNQGDSRWEVVLDGVMGGLSSGVIEETEAGLLFRGSLRLENNGGFSQIRSPIEEGSLGDAEGIEIEVRGDGRSYIFDVRVSNLQVMASSYQSVFETKDNEWVTLRLPFDAFAFHSFGRRVGVVGEMDPALINSVGITLADKQPGTFDVEIRAIRGYSTRGEYNSRLAKLGAILGEREAEAEQSPRREVLTNASFADRVIEVCALAIDRGVPMFNDGQPGACASVYEVALSSILLLGRDDLSGDARALIHRAIRDGQHLHDASERAWHYRRAIDALMRSYKDWA